MSFLPKEEKSFLSSLYSSIRPHHVLVLYNVTKLLKTTKWYQKFHSYIISVLSLTSIRFLPLIHKGYVPDFVIRYGIRVQLKDRLLLEEGKGSKNSIEEQILYKMKIISELKSSPIAIETGAANEQHYEVPYEFYSLCLGPRKKYSSGLWPSKKTTFKESEEEMLLVYCKRSGVQDGMKVVDLGCGWGSLSIFLLERFPNIKVTSISNSHSQREYILNYVKNYLPPDRLNNINVITCNVADDGGALDSVKNQDLIFSIEMFEHMKNYSNLLSKVHGLMKPNGKLFLHMFTHKTYTYHFDDNGWMSQYFFTGGTMPCDDLMLYFSHHFSILNHWVVNGTNYAKTSEAWLSKLDESWYSKKDEMTRILQNTYGEGKEQEWFWQWRLFYLACAELFGYRNGNEWVVSHYLFEARDRKSVV